MTVPTIRIDCGCGCGSYGSPRAKAWRSNGVLCVKRCQCRQCQGSRTKSQARRRENKVALDIGGARSYASGVVSGYDIHNDEVEIEETANVALVRGLKRWWLSAGVQKKMARLLARNLRARVFVATWDGKPALAVMPYEDFVALLQMRGKDVA